MKRLTKPSTLLEDAVWKGGLSRPEIEQILEATKKYERRMRRRLALARGYDPAHA